MQNVAKHVIQNTMFWTKNNKINEYSTMISSSGGSSSSRNNNDDDYDNNNNPDLK